MTLVFEDLSVYDPDASMTTDYMDIYISTESGQIVFPSDPLAIGAHNVTGNYQDMTSNITMRLYLLPIAFHPVYVALGASGRDNQI